MIVHAFAQLETLVQRSWHVLDLEETSRQVTTTRQEARSIHHEDRSGIRVDVTSLVAF